MTTRYERLMVARSNGVEPPGRGPGRHSLVNRATGSFGDLQPAGNQDNERTLLGNGNGSLLSEGLLYSSRAIRTIRRNTNHGHPGKPNRVFGGR